jgi:hypothetical protein
MLCMLSKGFVLLSGYGRLCEGQTTYLGVLCLEAGFEMRGFDW